MSARSIIRDRYSFANLDEVLDLLEEHLHFFAVGFREPGAAALSVLNDGPPSLLRLLDQPAFQVSPMRLGQVVVLADEEQDMIPIVLAEVTSYASNTSLGVPRLNAQL